MDLAQFARDGYRKVTRMRSISELDLVVVISVLAEKIQRLKLELYSIMDRENELDEAEIEDKCQLQDILTQHERILENLAKEYESARAEGIVLPALADLVRPFADRKIE